MYAIVEIAGHQYKVQQDQRLYVNRLKQDEGAKVSFDRVLLVDDGSKVSVGAPAVPGAAVNATVERHLKGDKVLVFKKKRRKGYQKLNGFRPSLTELVIKGIELGGKAKKASPKKAEAGDEKADAKPAAKKPAAKKAAPKKDAADKPAAKKPAAKKAAPKKEAAAKPAAKKPAAKKPAAKKAAPKKAAPKKAEDKGDE